MGTITDEAKNYEGKETKNIADLETVKTDLIVSDGEGKDADGKPFKYKFITVNNEDYRIPASVLKSLKVILASNPNLKLFKVMKVGEGLKTNYTVIPLA